MEFNISELIINIDKQSFILDVIAILISIISAIAAWGSWHTSNTIKKQALYDKRWNLYKKIAKKFNNHLNNYINASLIKHIEAPGVDKEKVKEHGYFQNQYKKFLETLSFKELDDEMCFLFGFNSDYLIKHIAEQNIKYLFEVSEYEHNYEILFSITKQNLFYKFLHT